MFLLFCVLVCCQCLTCTVEAELFSEDTQQHGQYLSVLNVECVTAHQSKALEFI